MRVPVRTLAIFFALLLPAAALAADTDGDIAGEDPALRSGVRQPLTGDPGWRALVAAGAGVVMVNSAGGHHHVTPELTVSAAWRASNLLTYRTRADFAWRREGTDRFFAETGYTWLAVRPEITLGTDRVQFLAGAGPSIILATTRLHGAGRNVHGNSVRPGLEYGVGLRWMLGRVPMGIDFGGHQRWTRHDFRSTVIVGFPVVPSRRSGDLAKEGIR